VTRFSAAIPVSTTPEIGGFSELPAETRKNRYKYSVAITRSLADDAWLYYFAPFS